MDAITLSYCRCQKLCNILWAVVIFSEIIDDSLQAMIRLYAQQCGALNNSLSRVWNACFVEDVKERLQAV